MRGPIGPRVEVSLIFISGFSVRSGTFFNMTDRDVLRRSMRQARPIADSAHSPTGASMGNGVKLADAVRAAKSIKVSHARKFVQHVVPEVVRPARIIWNQAIGAIFLLFALLFFGNATRYFNGLGSNSRNGVALGFSLFLGILMAIFGISSFLKARRISRP
jgi:hypothetical protein